VDTPNDYYKDNGIILSREDLNKNIDIYGRFILPIYAKISLWLHINYNKSNRTSQRYVNSYGNYSTYPSYISHRGEENAIMREEQIRTNKNIIKKKLIILLRKKKVKKKIKKIILKDEKKNNLKLLIV